MNQKKGFDPIIIALIVAILLGGGYFVYKVSQKPKAIESSVDTAVVNVVKKDQTDKKTKDWKTYTNTKYGYSIDYPNQWTANTSDARGISLTSPEEVAALENKKAELIERGMGGLGFDGYGPDISIFVKDWTDSLDNYVQNNPGDIIEQRDQITFASIPAYEEVKCGLNCYYELTTKYNNKIYKISFGTGHRSDKKSLTETDLRILSSFKFTTNISSPASNLKTYTYTKHGFSIELPKGFIPKEEQSEGGPALMISLPTGGLAYVTDTSFWEKYYINIPGYTYVKDEKIGDNIFKVYSAQLGNIYWNIYWLKKGNIGYEFSLFKFSIETNETGLKNLLKTFKLILI